MAPCSTDVPHRISTTAKHQDRHIKRLDILDTVGMSPHTQIEATKSITAQRVTATLQNNRLGSVPIHHSLDDRLKDGFVGLVGDSVAEGEVDTVVFAQSDSNVAELARARKVFTVFVERDSHDTVGRVEGFFDTITVVDVNVNVKDALFVAEELDYAEDNVCDRPLDIILTSPLG